jgi:hypothetical protein
MPFVNIVDDVVTLAKTAVEEDEKLHQKHGLKIGIQRGDPKADEYLKAANGLCDNLAEYLNNLSSEEIRKLETVMYFGRDGEDDHENDIPAYHDKLHPTDLDKSDIIRNIIEKYPALELYFSDAYKKAAELSIDLETII